jgi:hypothetical protein
MALFTMGQSLYPVGSLLIGALAEGVGPKVAVAICGGVCIATAATFWRASGLAMAGGRHGSPP